MYVARRFPLWLCLLGLLAALIAVPAFAGSSSSAPNAVAPNAPAPNAPAPTSTAPSSPVPSSTAPSPTPSSPTPSFPVHAPGDYSPTGGAVLSEPTTPGRKRVILDRIVRAIRSTEAGEYIRVATWNYDDEAIADALLEAFKRGVNVQVVVSSLVYSIHWNRTYATLNAKGGDDSFARRCSGGCRSKSVVHAKFVLISKAGRSSNVSMVGSFNLTKNTANKQWNDMVISLHKGLYDALVRTFGEYAADKPLPRPYRVTNMGKVKLTLWPSVGHRTILEEMQKVRCQIPRAHWVNGQRRTRIRIAIAGWFDSYGAAIARRVRTLWNSGCDIKIITGETGQGVNRALNARGGRGPVPVRELTVDRDRNGRAERYLHMKAFAIRGVFDGKPRANVLVTGSPNWSSRAQRSDEILVRYLDVPVMVGKYFTHINRLFGGRWSHR